MPQWISAAKIVSEYAVGEARLLQYSARGNLPCRRDGDGSYLFDADHVALLFRSRSALRMQLDGRYVSEQVDSLQFKLDPSSTNEVQTYLNARVSYEFGQDSRFEISAFGENLTSQKTCLDIGPFDDPTVTPANLGAVTAAGILVGHDGMRFTL